MFDDGIRIDYGIFCKKYDERIFFGYHLADLAMRKFLFDGNFFIEVKCECCKFNEARMYQMLYMHQIIGSNYTRGKTAYLVVFKMKNGVVLKKEYLSTGAVLTKEKAPVHLLPVKEKNENNDVVSSDATAEDQESVISDVSFLDEPLEEVEDAVLA